ncbi:MAG: carboxylating nicotinate-nucleotide diphosphorylase [Acidimicrobiales bacterium]
MTGAHPPMVVVREAVTRALAEDLTPLGDLTSALLPAGMTAVADFVPREEGVLAGVLCAGEAIRQVDAEVAVTWRADDGDWVEPGTSMGTVEGRLASILTVERTALNFLCHLSGVATLTRRFVDAVAAYGGGARIWDTRKTTPGMRALEKAAVRAGGGVNHRGNLSDWVMLKDNHLAHVGVEEAVKQSRHRWPGRLVHVECDGEDQVEAALAAGADAVLLDNMKPEEVRSCVALVHDIVNRTRQRRPLLEVSGGITLETVGSYAAAGADLISAGAITSSAPALDLALDVR